MMIRISRSRFSSPHEGEKSISLSLMTHSQKIITLIQWSLFVFLMLPRNWKLETLFWWWYWFLLIYLTAKGSYDPSIMILTSQSRSVDATAFNSIHHQHPFMAILNRAFYLALALSFFPLRQKAQVALTFSYLTGKHSLFVPCYLMSHWFPHSHLVQNIYPCFPPLLGSGLMSKCSL